MEERGLYLLTCPDHSPPLWGSQGRGVKQPAVPQSREEGSKGRCARCRLLVFRSFFPLIYSSAPPAHGVMLPTMGWVTPATIKAISH